MRTLLIALSFVLCACDQAEARHVGEASGAGGETGEEPESAVQANSTGNHDKVRPTHLACENDAAFWATGMSFTEPTAYPLAMGLEQALYGYEGHGISVVLSGDSISASATEADNKGLQGFVHEPTFTSLRRDIGGFHSTDPQATAWMRLPSGNDTVDVKLENVNVSVRATDDCSQIFVVLDAVIPVDQGGKVIEIDGEATTISDLAGGADNQTVGWPIRAMFSGESISFDYGSVEG